MTRLTLSVLGALQVTLGGEPVNTFRSAKTRALLVYLALESNRPHTRDALAGLLWPDQSNQTARDNLRQTLAILRKAIGDAENAQSPSLDITRNTIQFNLGSDHFVDAVAFTTLINACAAHRHRHSETCPSCAENRRQAVALYRGDFIDQFFLSDSDPFEEWAVLKRGRLRELALDALCQLAEFHTAHGDHQQSLTYAQRKLELDPWCEEAHQQAMRALALAGRYSAALSQYETCRRGLADEIGVEPTEETKALYQAIREHALGTRENNAQSPLLFRAPPCNLPAPVTPLFGRTAELAEFARLLSDPGCHLISITGPGGVGKTRLAMAAAAQQRIDFKDGVFFVSLASLDSAQLIAPTILADLEVLSTGSPNPEQQLINYLREREVLLVLDNMEHLLDGTQLVAELLRRAPRIALIVTSRERLNLQGERVIDLHGLEVPDEANLAGIEHYSAIQLFLQSAQCGLAVSTFSDEEKRVIVQICRMVEGMPLAIDLAATWVRTLAPAEIVKEIERNLDFLSTSVRDLPERHRSMRAVFDQSWKMLTPQEQRVMSRLSVLRGFRRESADQIAGASLSLLASLVGKSLIRRAENDRYDLHELFRQYALERLIESGEFEAVCDKHLRFFLELAETAEPKLRGVEQIAWLDRLEKNMDNLRAALEWSFRRSPLNETQPSELQGQVPLHFASVLYLFWKRRARWSEGRAWLERALALPAQASLTPYRVKALNAAMLLAAEQVDIQAASELAADNLLLSRELGYSDCIAQSLNSLGFLLWKKKDLQAARATCLEALELFRKIGHSFGTAGSLHNLSHIAINQGDYKAAQAYCQEAVAIYREQGDSLGLEDAVGDLGLIAYLRNDFVVARSYLEESQRLFQQAASVPGLVSALNRLGDLARCQQDYARAEKLYAECLRLYRGVGDKDEFPSLLHNMGYVARHQGDISTAFALFGEGLSMHQETRNRAGIAECVAGIAGVLIADGRARPAARLFSAAAALREADGVTLWPADRLECEHDLALLHQQLDEAAISTAWAEGREMDLEHVIAEAMAEAADHSEG